MKANEIMVGDWVEYRFTGWSEKGGVYKDYQYVQISTIGELYVKADNDRVASADGEDFFPISLTPEILEKNGFYWGNTASEEDFCGAVGCGYPESGWCFDEGAGEIKIIFPKETDGGLIRLDDQSADRHLELIFVEPIMVHELQHCLKLVGISKEIEL